jgi:hypothetical protein
VPWFLFGLGWETFALIEQIDSKAVGAQQRSIIDRCISAVYQETEETGIVPTIGRARWIWKK